MLVQCRAGWCILVNIDKDGGNRYCEPIEVGSATEVTEEELRQMYSPTRLGILEVVSRNPLFHDE